MDCALQPDDTHAGFALKSHLKKSRELLHRESGLSNQSSIGVRRNRASCSLVKGGMSE